MSILDPASLMAGALPIIPIQKNGPATVVGRLFSLFYSAGMPGAAAVPTPGVAGAALTNYAGQLPFQNAPASAETRLMSLNIGANVAGAVILCDRLWHNSGLSATLTTAQTVNSVPLPARDRSGTINGSGVLLGLEVTTVMGAGAPTVTLTYTNPADATGKVSVSPALTSALTAGSFIQLPLAAGDTGIKSLQTFQLSATMTSGAFSLVAYRIMAMLPIPAGTLAASLNALQAGFPRHADDTTPFLLWLPATTTAPVIVGSMNYAQG